MSKFISFVRVNNNNIKYTLEQIDGIKEYVAKHNITVDSTVKIEVNIPNEEQNIVKLLENCNKGCTILAYDLNVFGRTTEAILKMVNILLDNEAQVIIIKQGLDLINGDMLTQIVTRVIGMTIDLEKDLMSLRTKEALTAKKIDGVHLGKPKGTIQKSKFDKQREKIEELLAVGLSVRKISKVLGYNNHIGLNNYIKKRNIREKAANSLLDIAAS